MMPKMNPRQMESVMRRMGISQVEIPAKEVIIRCDDRIITINNPSVTKVKMMGADTFQIGGEVSESAISAEPEISDDDVDLVVAQTGAGSILFRYQLWLLLLSVSSSSLPMPLTPAR